MICGQILNIRRYIEQNGYDACSRRNGELPWGFLDNVPARMFMSLSSDVVFTVDKALTRIDAI